MGHYKRHVRIKQTFPVSTELTIRYRTYYNESMTRVMRALKSLDKATVKEIYDYLRKETKDNNLMHTIEIRTIQRKLKYLKKEGILKRLKYDKYILTEKARSDIRYFPEDFRDNALSNLVHIENNKSHEYILNELVKAFGAYVVYCFIEALKPTPSDDSKISLQWLEDVLSPFNLYLSFLSAFDIGNNKQGKPSGFYNELAEMLSHTLQRKYPSQYDYLLKSKTNCLKLTSNNSMSDTK
jgi:DNA-binding transcriptional ArsR family regulator